MAELLEVYDLNGKLIGIEEREKFYSTIKDEFLKSGKVTKKVKSIRLLLMNSKGRIYLQKRSKLKSENAGLYDKTVGGHVSKDESYDIAVVRECAEELGFPASILSTKDFDKAIRGTNLEIVGLFRKVDLIPNFISERITQNGIVFAQPFMTAIYIGYYNGPIRFIDGESSGIEVFSLDELKDDIKNNPVKFTEDIKILVKKYEKFLQPIN